MSIRFAIMTIIKLSTYNIVIDATLNDTLNKRKTIKANHKPKSFYYLISKPCEANNNEFPRRALVTKIIVEPRTKV